MCFTEKINLSVQCGVRRSLRATCDRNVLHCRCNIVWVASRPAALGNYYVSFGIHHNWRARTCTKLRACPIRILRSGRDGPPRVYPRHSAQAQRRRRGSYVREIQAIFQGKVDTYTLCRY